MKDRLDCILAEKKLFSSREKAKAAIKNGDVYVDGVPVTKAGTMIDIDSLIEIKGEQLKYVSRGGLKLEKAIEEFDININDSICIDIGASTGGFTDCMLQNGARKVYAIDVGTNQLAESLLNDSRVVSMEQTNIRNVSAEDIGELVDFISIDVSFISLIKILDNVKTLLKPAGKVVCLIKPQFEAGIGAVGKKGVVKDKKIHIRVVKDVINYAISIGFTPKDLSFSPIKGPEGNIEYLVLFENIRIDEKNVVQVVDYFEGQANEVVTSSHSSLNKEK